MSVRLFHRGARWVFVVRRMAPGHERWWSPHLRSGPPDWGSILGQQVSLLALPYQTDRAKAMLSCSLGEIHWTSARGWSIIAVRLQNGSKTKRRLVAAALLKAARYARPR